MMEDAEGTILQEGDVCETLSWDLVIYRGDCFLGWNEPAPRLPSVYKGRWQLEPDEVIKIGEL